MKKAIGLFTIATFCFFLSACFRDDPFCTVSLNQVSGSIEGEWVIDKSQSYFISTPECDALLRLDPENKFVAKCLSINSIFTRKLITDTGVWTFGADINDELTIKLVMSDGTGINLNIYKFRDQGLRLVHKLEQPDEQYQLVLKPSKK